MNIFKAEINNNFDSHVLLHDGFVKVVHHNSDEKALLAV